MIENKILSEEQYNQAIEQQLATMDEEARERAEVLDYEGWLNFNLKQAEETADAIRKVLHERDEWVTAQLSFGI